MPTFGLPSGAVPLAVAGSGQDPQPLGTMTVGTQAVGARADHVHQSLGAFWLWGPGSDGNVTFDGTTAVTLGGSTYTPTASVYTITTPIVARNLTLGAGVTLLMSQGCVVSVAGTLACPTGSAIIAADGNNASGSAAGAARPSFAFPAAGAGGAGGTAAGSAGGTPGGTASSNIAASTSGAGGAGGTGAAGSGVAATITTRGGEIAQVGRDPMFLLRGHIAGFDIASNNGTIGLIAGTSGGGGGGGDGTNAGGGGGSGAGVIIVNARKVTGTVNVRAKGGNGATPATGNCGGGGGGGGGYALLNSGDLTGWTGAATAPGGTGGSGVGTGSAGVAGGTGFAFATTWA